MALHARTSVNVSSGQQLMLSLPSPFACQSIENLHISEVCSYAVHREQKAKHLRDCVCVCVCVCVYVHTKGPFLPMDYFSLLFFSRILSTAIEPPPSRSYKHHLHIHIQLPQPQSASCSIASRVCAPVGERKTTTRASCTG